MKRIKLLVLPLLAGLLSGCNLVVMNPSGDIAAQQSQLIIYSTVLMLIVIVPVMALTIFFAFKYRESNEDATYDPDWDHSISLEIVVWSVPLAIIICLAGLTWVATHRLEPYSPVSRISETQPVKPGTKPLIIQAVAMDWKWLFIYPEHGIASINEVAAIVDRPVEFQITSSTAMNSLYIPALAGQIYGMPGMQTKLNAVINKPGVYKGFSANYSGEGFSKMRFKFHGLSPEDFDAWTQKVTHNGRALDRLTLETLEKPTIGHPVTYFNITETGLWERLVNQCVGTDKLCRHDMMVVDALGGGGIDGLWNRERFKGICSSDNPELLMSLIRPKYQNRKDEIMMSLSRQAKTTLQNQSAIPQ